jgi:hypothetical protein
MEEVVVIIIKHVSSLTPSWFSTVSLPSLPAHPPFDVCPCYLSALSFILLCSFSAAVDAVVLYAGLFDKL